MFNIFINNTTVVSTEHSLIARILLYYGYKQGIVSTKKKFIRPIGAVINTVYVLMYNKSRLDFEPRFLNSNAV